MRRVRVVPRQGGAGGSALNTFETPKWVQVEAARSLLRSLPPTRSLEPTLSDDEAIEVALRVAAALYTGDDDDPDPEESDG